MLLRKIKIKKKEETLDLLKYKKYEYNVLRGLSKRCKRSYILKKQKINFSDKQKKLIFCLMSLHPNLKKKILNNYFLYKKNEKPNLNLKKDKSRIFFFQKRNLISKRGLLSFFQTKHLRLLGIHSRLNRIKNRYKVYKLLKLKAFLYFGKTSFRKRGPIGVNIFKDIRRKVTTNFCFINQTRTNIYITLCNYRGNVIFSGSGGILKVRKRREAVSTEVAIKIANIITGCILNFSLKKVCLIYRVFPKTFFIKPFLREIKKISNRTFKFRYYLNLPKIAHNGCRFRKKKRK